MGLHRRRLEGEDLEPHAPGMAGEVDEDIDAVVVDAPRRLVERQAGQRDDGGEVAAEGLRSAVHPGGPAAAGGERVAEELEA